MQLIDLRNWKDDNWAAALVRVSGFNLAPDELLAIRTVPLATAGYPEAPPGTRAVCVHVAPQVFRDWAEGKRPSRGGVEEGGIRYWYVERDGCCLAAAFTQQESIAAGWEAGCPVAAT